ncbi:hypothetical protein J2S70_001556 [Trueperella bonasi]|uniref:Reverse transcriptase domain-containing protein n=1 Tax=Trueperella bonasi TaxID=312286 RepID=A0ABT9NHU9_9ACTO|nr:hypothetical protein [Trueperella bonasi]MDP9806974.1 hypothetical protein [Trueperella bonasi]
MLKLDLHNFFPSIREDRIFDVHRTLGYGKLFSFELTRLSTVPEEEYRIEAAPWDEQVLIRVEALNKYPVIGGYSRADRGVLPQGSPTSGVLANIIATGMDLELVEFDRENGLTYTIMLSTLAFILRNLSPIMWAV